MRRRLGPPETEDQRLRREEAKRLYDREKTLKEQLRYDLGDIRWAKVDTGGSQEECVENAKAALRAANVRLEE